MEIAKYIGGHVRVVGERDTCRYDVTIEYTRLSPFTRFMHCH